MFPKAIRNPRMILLAVAGLALLFVAGSYLSPKRQLEGGYLSAAVLPAFGVVDAALRKSKALPAAASTSTVTDPIDMRHNNNFIADVEFVVSAPALTTTILPDTRTCTYSIEVSDDEAFSSPVVLHPSIGLQTGAGGAGAVAAKYRFRVPSDVKRFIRAKATFGASTTDGSTKSFAFYPVF